MLRLTLVGLAGCGGGGGGGTTGTGGTSGGSCPAGTGTGTLSVKISGTPNGTGTVALGSGQQLTTSADVTVPAGPNTVNVYLTAFPGALVRTAYEPTVDDPTPCVKAGQVTTVNVVYSVVQTSGGVWTGLENGPTSATLLGFDQASVGQTATVPASVVVDTHGADGFTFDPYGDIWVTGGTVADPPVARYPADLFANSGTLTPDLTLDSPAFSGGVPGAKVLAFDSLGDLWVSVVWSGKVVEFTAAQLATGGTKTPAVEVGGLSAPAGIAFDRSGNLWVASNGDDRVVRINAAHLAASGSGADLAISAVTGGAVSTGLTAPLGIAFDGSGNLWVNYDGTIAELPASALAGNGTATVEPPVQLVTDPAALPSGIAFDEAGGLWLGYNAGTLARFDATQLIGQGPAVPATVISSGDIGPSGSTGWVAIYPAPAFTPLAHAFE